MSALEQKRLEASGCRWSTLFDLRYFDPVLNHTIDPMHCLYLGIAKRMTKFYLTSNLIDKKNLPTIQKLIDSVRVPAGLGRIPRKIASGYSSLTSDQWKSWTIVYSALALHGLLPEPDYKIWMTFVKAVTLLSKKLITQQDITIADALINKFCKAAQSKYGEVFITPNFHMANHLKEVIEDFGPVYSFWCYSFER